MRFDGNPGNRSDWWLSQDPATDRHHAHFAVYLAVLNQQLLGARAGTLAPDWRATIDTQPVPPRAKLNPLAALRLAGATADRTASCLMYATLDEAPDAGELLACARRDVAARPLAPWEPYAAAGDWETAIRSWLDTALSVSRHQEALAHRNAIRHPRRDTAWAGRPDPLREDHQVVRDLLVVSSVAASSPATGNYPNLWRSVLDDRSRRWQDQDRAAAYRLALLDFDTPWALPGHDPDDPYGGAYRVPALPGPIPEYWTAPQPEQSA